MAYAVYEGENIVNNTEYEQQNEVKSSQLS